MGKVRHIIGLTGGIATGKSTASGYLAHRHGLPVLDADVFAREAVAQGSEILEWVRDRYGPNILLSDGNLNRSQLGKIIFSEPVERQWIEQQIHPYVRARFESETDALPLTQIVVHSIPLLFEANLTHLVDEIWVVACSPEQQLERLVARSQLTENEAQSRINAQIDLADKCKRADEILDNSMSKENLYSQIDKLASVRNRKFLSSKLEVDPCRKGGA